MSLAADSSVKPQIACDSIAGNFSISELPLVNVSNPEIIEAINNLNQTIIERCEVDKMEYQERITTAIETLSKSLSSNSNHERLIEALDTLNSTLSATPKGSLIELLGGAIFSVLAAFTFNFLYWKVKERKERLHAAINEAKDALVEFEDNSVEYWSQDYEMKNVKTNTIQQAKIKANHSLLLSTYINRILPLLSRAQTQTERSDLKKNVQLEIENIFDIATGGDFESSQRKANRKNVADIIRRCTRIRTRLANLGS